VRFADASAAQQAAQLSGAMIDGHSIEVELDTRSKDGTKIMVHGLPPAYDWKRLKDYFKQCGTVIFAEFKKPWGAWGAAPSAGQAEDVPTPKKAAWWEPTEAKWWGASHSGTEQAWDTVAPAAAAPTSDEQAPWTNGATLVAARGLRLRRGRQPAPSRP